MLEQNNIAFFIDVDNMDMTSVHYMNVMDQLNQLGKVTYGKVYGVGERKHKDIIADLDSKGFKADRCMRIKRRGKKDFDNRIFVDVAEFVSKNHSVNAVCIIAQPTDLVYLYGFLHERGIRVFACDNCDEETNALIDEVVDIGKVVELKFGNAPKQKKPQPKPQPKPVVEQPAPAVEQKPATQDLELDKTNALLREIAALREMSQEKKQEVAQPVAEQKPVVEQPAPSISQEIASLNNQVEQLNEQEAQQKVEQPRASYVPQDDSDLIRKIEQLRKSNADGSDDDMLEKIRKLLDLGE